MVLQCTVDTVRLSLDMRLPLFSRWLNKSLPSSSFGHCSFFYSSTMASFRHPENLAWLQSMAPRFSLHGDKVSVLRGPSEFYDQVLHRCQTALRRVTLASLYLGTGSLERQLVSALDNRLRSDNLEVCVLLDFARSSRGQVSSRSLLLPLLSSQHCKVALYHSPALRGFLKLLLPQRWNELVGLQHMKVYLFDDSVILSGANLSHDYFWNRQDRYVVLEDCPDLADFLDGLVKRVADFSLELTAQNQLKTSSAWLNKEHPYLGDGPKFIQQAREHVWSYYRSYVGRSEEATGDTWVYPLIEMGQLGIRNDSVATKRLIESAPAQSRLALSTGYFNLTERYAQSIAAHSDAPCTILMAHPSANGFLGSSFPAGGIPAAYTLIAHRFLRLLHSVGAQHRVSLWEYQRQDWTFHAKGLWYTLPDQQTPSLTLVGSPNFGYRSEARDLELQCAVVSVNSALRGQLSQELGELNQRATPFPEKLEAERRPPLWVRLVVAFFRNFF